MLVSLLHVLVPSMSCNLGYYHSLVRVLEYFRARTALGILFYWNECDDGRETTLQCKVVREQRDQYEYRRHCGGELNLDNR